MERQHSTTTRNPNMLRSYEFVRNKSKTSRFVNKIKMYTFFSFFTRLPLSTNDIIIVVEEKTKVTLLLFYFLFHEDPFFNFKDQPYQLITVSSREKHAQLSKTT